MMCEHNLSTHGYAENLVNQEPLWEPTKECIEVKISYLIYGSLNLWIDL